MPPPRLHPALRHLFRAPAWLYHLHCGRLLGHRFILLVHTGRRTGRRRETVLEVMEYRRDQREFIVMSAFGRNAGWLRNIEATRYAEVAVGRERFTATHRILGMDDAMRVVAGYERRNWFAAPVIRMVLSRLLGWHYDGTEGARRRLAMELPLIAFRPDRPERDPDRRLGG